MDRIRKSSTNFNFRSLTAACNREKQGKREKQDILVLLGNREKQENREKQDILVLLGNREKQGKREKQDILVLLGNRVKQDTLVIKVKREIQE